MGQFAETLWIWMLILVLPAQALASASSGSCGPWHHSVASLAKDQRAAYPSNQKATVSVAGHDVGMDDDKAALQSEKSRDTSHSKGVRCSACTVCCIGASVLLTWNSWRPAIGYEATFGDRAVALFTNYVPARLERPPRLS